MDIQVKTVPLTKSAVKQLRPVRQVEMRQSVIWEKTARLLGYLPYVANSRDMSCAECYLVSVPGETVLMAYWLVEKLFGKEKVDNCNWIVLEK